MGNDLTRPGQTGVSAYSNPYEAYAGETAKTIVGDLLKFSKFGDWTTGKDDTGLDIGTTLVADMRNVSVGWQKWGDRRVVEAQMGLVADGHRPPQRKTLGDTDPDEWETDNRGVPIDPWQLTSILYLRNPEDEEEVYTYSTSSVGGRTAVSKVIEAYGKAMGKRLIDPNDMPIVELQTDHYKHVEYGKIFTPVLKVKGWQNLDTGETFPLGGRSMAAPALTTAVPTDDDPPFPEPVPFKGPQAAPTKEALEAKAAGNAGKDARASKKSGTVF